MFKLSIASGKGGTGKTTVAVNLALVLEEKVQLLDCDVEEPNAHLFLKPDIRSRLEVGIPVPEIDLAKCSFCGLCADVCAFNALAVFKDQVMVLPELCHGCGSCSYLCPEQAIIEKDRPIGVIESGLAGKLSFAHGKLNPGEAMSPPLIKVLRKMAVEEKFTIIDAPPGTSCPVVSAVEGTDYCLLVTEPTPFGLNDLDLACRMVARLGISAGVVINRSDIGSGEVEKYCQKQGLPVLHKIPFDLEMAKLYARGEVAVLHLPAWRDLFLELAIKIEKACGEVLRP